MPLTDFAAVFGSGGVYDKFFTESLEKLVDTSQRPWSWRPDSVESSPGMLAQFERVARIREMFFGPGGEDARSWSSRVKLSKLDAGGDAAVRRHRRPGVRREARRREPQAGHVARSEKGRRRLRHVRGSKSRRPTRSIEFEGPWAWFRMIDRTMAPQPDVDGLSVLSLQTQYHRALVTIEAPTGRGNPFGSRDVAAVWMWSVMRHRTMAATAFWKPGPTRGRRAVRKAAKPRRFPAPAGVGRVRGRVGRLASRMPAREPEGAGRALARPVSHEPGVALRLRGRHLRPDAGASA